MRHAAMPAAVEIWLNVYTGMQPNPYSRQARGNSRLRNTQG